MSKTLLSGVFAGQRSVFIVKLPEGTYDAYCPVDEHREKGMAGTITAR